MLAEEGCGEHAVGLRPLLDFSSPQFSGAKAGEERGRAASAHAVGDQRQRPQILARRGALDHGFGLPVPDGLVAREDQLPDGGRSAVLHHAERLAVQRPVVGQALAVERLVVGRSSVGVDLDGAGAPDHLVLQHPHAVREQGQLQLHVGAVHHLLASDEKGRDAGERSDQARRGEGTRVRLQLLNQRLVGLFRLRVQTARRRAEHDGRCPVGALVDVLEVEGGAQDREQPVICRRGHGSKPTSSQPKGKVRFACAGKPHKVRC